MTAVDKTNDQRTLIPIMGIGQALAHHCSCITAYVVVVDPFQLPRVIMYESVQLVLFVIADTRRSRS